MTCTSKSLWKSLEGFNRQEKKESPWQREERIKREKRERREKLWLRVKHAVAVFWMWVVRLWKFIVGLSSVAVAYFTLRSMGVF